MLLLLIKELYPHKRQPLRWCSGSGGGAVFGVQDFLHAFWWILAVANLDQGAGNDADHVIKETGSRYADGDNVAVAEDFDSGDSADGSLYLGAGTTEAGKIVASDQVRGCLAHFVYV